MIAKKAAIAALAGMMLAAPAPATAQRDGQAGDPPASLYAGMATVPGTSLTPGEVDALRSGEGMRLALPAELNGFPGPLHVLELAEQLGLASATVDEVEAIRAEMLDAAIRKGEEVIEADRALTALFREATRGAGPAPGDDGIAGSTADDIARRTDEVTRRTGELARLRGELQAIHLAAHLRTRALLTDEQVARYDRLRGYASDGEGAHDHGGH